MPTKKHATYLAKLASKGRVKTNTIVLKPVRESNIRQKLEEWRGAFGGFPGGVPEINAWLREMRGWNELEDDNRHYNPDLDVIQPE